MKLLKADLAKLGLTPIEVVASAPTGTRETVYDVSLPGTELVPHSIITNGIVTHNSASPEYYETIMRKVTRRLFTSISEVFGEKDNKGQWVHPPVIRYRSEAVAEKFFDFLASIERKLPDKKLLGDQWYYVYEDTKPNRAIVKDKFDKSYFSKTGKLRVPAPDGSLQAIVLVDSYPAMLPEKQDVDDPNNAIAMQARMFSDQLKRVKGRMRGKRIAVFGINQLRLKPMVMFGCLHGSARVVLADGSTMLMEDIVQNKIKGPVMSYNPVTKKVEPKAIKRWFNNGHTDDWLQFKLGGVDTANGLTSLRCTPNHLLMSGKGKLKRAKSFKDGDTLMLTSLKPALNEVQRQVILGSILGDGWFKVKNRGFGVRGGFAHKEADSSYVEYKANLLGSYGQPAYGGKMLTVETCMMHEPWLTQIVKTAKGKGRKYHFCKELFEKIEPLGLAIWLMDDGARSGKPGVGTLSYSLEDTRKISRALNRKFGTKCRVKVHRDKYAPTGYGYGVQFCEKMMALIAPYLYEPFYEGFTTKHRDLPGFASAKVTPLPPGDRFTYPAVIRSITPGAPTQSVNGRLIGNTKYDLEIEGNHLYVVNGAVVHNSPEYEPAGEALKLYSDVRLKCTSRAISAVDGAKGKGQIELEPSLTGDGDDEYRYVHIRAHKNKLSVPYLECFLRLWIKDVDGVAQGFDLVYDTYEYLRSTGQATGNRKAIHIHLHGQEKPFRRPLPWSVFKTLILGDKPKIKSIFTKLGLKPMMLRTFCEKQMKSGKGLDLYFAHQKAAKKAAIAKKKANPDADDEGGSEE
jgi:hypothetical protein